MPGQPPWARRHRDMLLGSDAQYALFAQELTFLPLTIDLDPVTGSIAATLDVSGTLSVTGGVTGTIAATLAVSGTLSHNANVGSGTIASVLAISGTLSQQTGQTGSIASALALTGVISVTGTLSGGVAATLALAGTVTLDPGQSGTVRSRLTVFGVLTVGGAPLAGSVASQLSVTGALTLPVELLASVRSGLAVSGALGVVTRSVNSGILGCGTYQVLIFLRGGKTAVGALPFTSLSYERQLDRVSQASVQIDGGAACAECRPILAQVDGTEHEVAIYRNDVRVWAGPITKVTLSGERATVAASDLGWWLGKRRLRQNHSHKSVDLSTIFQAYVDDAIALDNTMGLVILSTPCGVLGTRAVLAAQHLICAPELDELSRTGIDWTVVDRQVICGGAVVPTPTPTTGNLPLLMDESFIDEPEVVIDADTFGTDWLIRGGGGGGGADTVYGEAGGGSVTFGLVDQVVSEEAILDDASALSAANTRLALAGAPVAVVSQGTLDPQAGVTMAQLVPGAPMAIRLVKPAWQVLTTYRLSGIKVTVDTSNNEQVTASFQPLGTVETP